MTDLFTKMKDIIGGARHRDCKHSGPCGPEYHGKRGGGYCKNCWKCNKR